LTKTKVEYNLSKPLVFYNLTIPKTNSILELKNYLAKEYRIDLVKKKRKVNVKIATFY